MAEQHELDLRALVFDVFGTVVDWRRSVIAEGLELGRHTGIEADWEGLADAWRGCYQPSMDQVRQGLRPWTKLDDLHRESLRALMPRFGLQALSEEEVERFNRAWHRLTPWPDSVPGLTRLKTRYIIATLSNGNVALLLNMARNAGLPWDTILGAEPARAYKPLPEAYLRTVDILGLVPSQVMMVAAHNDDLLAARECGLRTAFIPRPAEYGPHQSRDFSADHSFDYVADDLQALAEMLGC